MFGKGKEEATGGWRKIHKEELIICIIHLCLLRRMRWTESVAQLGEIAEHINR
jgi:hypothetical protein